MKINSFWVVTRPTKFSTRDDVLFESDLSRLRLQFLGGLDPDAILGCYTEEQEAASVAANALAEVQP